MRSKRYMVVVLVGVPESLIKLVRYSLKTESERFYVRNNEVNDVPSFRLHLTPSAS